MSKFASNGKGRFTRAFCQLFAQRLYLLYQAATCFGHILWPLQGATCLIQLYIIYGKLSQVTGRLYIRGLVKKYTHWCFNVLWVGGTAFCTFMLTDSTFVSACGKFQHHHTV